MEPLFVNIEGNSHNDGPGIRSVIFFKGCSLNCLWCHNPESKKIDAELWWNKEECIDDGACIEVCPKSAISRNNPYFIDRNICDLCFKCVDVCPSKALRRVGQRKSVDDIISEIMKYKPFFDTSGGGITLSGGEPTLPIEFTSTLLKRLRQAGIHTLLETSGSFDLSKFNEVILPYVDLIYFDIKFIDSSKHEYYCGVNNERILNNFIELHRNAASGNFEILPRTPLIPQITDTKENIRDIAAFYNKYAVNKAAVLPNNPAWILKCDKLGQPSVTECRPRLKEIYDEKETEKIKAYYMERHIRAS